MPLVLAENDATESGISYEDRTGASYQFPRMYSRLVRCGERFVYYKGRKKVGGGRAPQIYFGSGIIGTISEEPSESGRLRCEILDFRPFARPLYFKDGQHRYFESGGVRKGFFQQGVRRIAEADFERILFAAESSSNSNVRDTREASGSTYGSPDQILEVERFSLERAVAHLREEYPHATIIPQIRNNPGFDILVVKDGTSLFVEVKGTQKPIPRFIITRGEVEFSRRNADCYRLLVVYGINLTSKVFSLWSHAGAIEELAFLMDPMHFNCAPLSFAGPKLQIDNVCADKFIPGAKIPASG